METNVSYTAEYQEGGYIFALQRKSNHQQNNAPNHNRTPLLPKQKQLLETIDQESESSRAKSIGLRKFKDSDPPIVPVITNSQLYSFLSASEEQQVKEMASSGDFKGARLFINHFQGQNNSQDQLLQSTLSNPREINPDINTNSLTTMTQNQYLN